MRAVLTTLVAATVLSLLATAAAVAEEPPPVEDPAVDIVILGGTAVVPEGIEAHLASCTTGSVTRIAGRNRYATAADIARNAFPGGAATVYLANGTAYPDAVAGGPVAALGNAPLLLTTASAIPSETRRALADLGANRVIILGGVNAVSDAVAADLATSYSVERIAGPTRDATAAAISASAFDAPVDVVYVATEANFPDALVGGPAAYTGGGPILLTNPEDLSSATRSEIERLVPSMIVILGGPAAVGPAVEEALSAYAPVTRLAGRDRYATAVAIAKTLPRPVSKVYITTGLNFPDAVAATPLALSNPMLLTADLSLPHATSAAITSFTGVPCSPMAKVSEFTTYYPAGQSRVTNIHLIADAADGAVVLPGEVFSLNDRVGERTIEKGYVAAGAIIGGELYCCDHPANIGGGTSQFATTLYNAIFFGAYEDVYHRPHSIWFSRYPMGREATLGWTGPDVQFRNDTSVPVTLRATHTSTSVTVELWGWNEGRKVSTTTTGSATTEDGGPVRVDRTIAYADGTSSSQTWWWTYNPLHPDAR